MSASDQPLGDAQNGPEDDEARGRGVQTPSGVHEVPLFLRGLSDGRKGDAQDEKDEMEE